MSSDIVGDLIGGYKPATAPAPTVSAAKVSEDDPACNTTGITDKGIIDAGKWQAIINAALLVYNTANSLKMAKLQRDLAEKYLELAEDYTNYYNSKYKPLEIKLTEEAYRLPKYVRDKDDFTKGTMLAAARGRAGLELNKQLSCVGRYCSGLRAAILTEQLMTQASAEAAVAGLAHRTQDKEEIAWNNHRWEKRSQVLKLGRDIPTDALSFANLAAGIFGSLGGQAAAGADAAIWALGYDRAGTVYPARHKPISVSSYVYDPTKLESFKAKALETYTPPPEPQPIKLSG